MASVLATPPVTKAALAYLTPLLDVPMASQVPTARPTAFVQLRAAGGADRNLAIGDRNLTVDCWETTDSRAIDLAERVHGLLFAAPRAPQSLIRTVTEVGGPIPMPDPDDPSPRYRFTVRLGLRRRLLP